MQEIPKKKCIFKKKRSILRFVSFKLLLTFGLGLLCGFYLSDATSLAVTGLEALSLEVAYNSK